MAGLVVDAGVPEKLAQEFQPSAPALDKPGVRFSRESELKVTEGRQRRGLRLRDVPGCFLSSLRHAFEAILSSWILLTLLIVWLCSRIFAPADMSLWSSLSSIPILGVAVDFVWSVTDWMDACYRVEWKYRWVPSALTHLWNILPSKEQAGDLLAGLGKLGAAARAIR